MTVEERLQPALTFQPEVASLNMGSMNFGLYPMLNRFKEFKHPLGAAHLENSRDLVFRNTFNDIEFILTHCSDNGTRFEFECYDVGHLYNLAHFVEREAWSSHPSSCRPCSAFSAASARIRRM